MSLHEVFPNGERDLSDWLTSNLPLLSQEIGVGLSFFGREVAAGPYRADVVAKDESGHLVIIENQITPTDHNHLGKLLTYLTIRSARTAVWISRQARSEHIRVVHTLNQMTPSDIAFYLLEVRGMPTETGKQVPVLTVVVAPGMEWQDLGMQAELTGEVELVRERFWDELRVCAQERGQEYVRLARIDPNSPYYLTFRAHEAIVGCPRNINFSFLLHGRKAKQTLANHAGVELVIQQKNPETLRIFNELRSRERQIHQAFSHELVWQLPAPSKKAKTTFLWEIGDWENDESTWPRIHEEMLNAMERLIGAVDPHIA